MACTYSTGCKLPRNHNLPQGCPRLWEWQHPKIGNVRDFYSTVRRVYELYVPNSLWTHGSNMDGTWSLGSELPWNHNLPQGRPRLWEQGTPNLAMYAIFLSTAWGIWVVCTKYPLNPQTQYGWHIQYRVQTAIESLSATGTPSFVGTRTPQTWPYTLLLIPQQGIYELYVPNSSLTHGPNMAGTYSLVSSKLP